MLKESSWLPLALKLDLQDGRSARVDHDCGAGRTLSLSREGQWLNAKCWRCNDRGSHRIDEPLGVRIARLTAAREADAVAARDSSPAGTGVVSEWPREARLWFAKAGLSSEDIGALDARYDASTRRVVIPCGPSFWIARALFPGQSPKYLAPSTGRHDVLLRFKPSRQPGDGPLLGEGAEARGIVLTEDVLSAYKVGKVCEAWPMLGTAPSQKLIAELLKAGRPVNVWLDNDLPPVHTVNRGQVAAKKVLRLLRSMDLQCRNIVSLKDPKLMTYEQIKEHLK